MTTELIGIERTSFTGKDNEEVKMVRCYIVTRGVQKDGLVGDMADCVRLMRTDAPNLKIGKVNLTYIPDGKGGARLADIVNI